MVAPVVSALLFQSSLLPEIEPDKTGVFVNCATSINNGYVHDKINRNAETTEKLLN